MTRFELERFVAAQAGVYDGVLDELRRGRKVGHWIWFIFPQVAGLGRSAMSERYAIGSLAEAQAYLAHPILGPRLRECAELLLAAPPDRTAADILGELDALKVRSSMTLFARAHPSEPLIRRVLDRFYGGAADALTDRLLDAGGRRNEAIGPLRGLDCRGQGGPRSTRLGAAGRSRHAGVTGSARS